MQLHVCSIITFEINIFYKNRPCINIELQNFLKIGYPNYEKSQILRIKIV